MDTIHDDKLFEDMIKEHAKTLTTDITEEDNAAHSESKVNKYPPERLRGLEPYKPGQSGNPAGRKPDIKYISEAIRDLIKSNPELLREIVLKLAGEAKKGNVQAFKEFADRGEGKVADKIEGTDIPVTIILKPARERDDD